MSDHTKLNSEHFDKRAASWDSPLKVALAKKCSDAMLQAEGVQWDPASTVVVDFACGTGTLVSYATVDSAGLISQGLEPYARNVAGVDISAGMVDAYNQKAKKMGIEEKMKAVCVDILAPGAEIRAEELRNVDVVVCSMSYHHIEDIVNTTKVLASLLKKGGHLLVVDLLEDEVSRSFHGDGHKHGHRHSDHPSQDHGGHHGERMDDPDNAPAIHTVAHIGGISVHALESAFNATGVLENVIAKKAFSARRNEISDRPGHQETEFQFVIGSGRRM